MSNNSNIVELNDMLGTKDPKEIVAHALKNHARCAISFSGAEDVVLIDMALKVLPKDNTLSVFSLDTGRLHLETYEFIEKVRNHYKIDIEILSPETTALEKLTREKGLFSFYKDGHAECCGIRKLAPLRRKLGQLDAWITGQRRDQSPGTRNNVAVVENDLANASDNGTLIKYNPLALLSSQQVWDYIHAFDVPYNPLHDRGFVSIGCAPCTKATTPGQHEREGRWWWEEATAKECGLHNTAK